jgi:hypothetical protein
VDDDLRQDHADGRCIRFDLLNDRVLAARKQPEAPQRPDGSPAGRISSKEETPKAPK